MRSSPVAVVRRLAPALFVLVLATTLFVVAQRPAISAADEAALASRFRFTEMPIALPENLPQKSVRVVNPRYEHIRSWISSVGAAISVNDLDGRGVANDLCLVDTRSDAAIVTPAPAGGDNYQPFVLNPAPLPMSDVIAPMGCVPGDYNGDGWNDLLVYYWGRTPVVFLHRGQQGPLTLASYQPTELIAPSTGPGGTYQGKQWNTNAVAVADFDGDGHPDLGVFNYFPESGVLDPHGQPNVQMNHSMSRATNAGGAHILRWTGATATSVSFEEEPAINPRFATGWTLGASSADLDGDLLPELYLANDFGQDRMFHNRSTPGDIKFELVEGERDALTPKSLVVGHDSFKGMSIEFGDLNGNGQFDAFVSNITTPWGLEESNLVWINTEGSAAGAKAKLEKGIAPFRNEAGDLDMAWTGWGWDAKMADFTNSGHLAVVQACGFVKGTINRFNWLQELAMSNDVLLENPDMWPKAEPGDDIAGHEPMAFWVPDGNGRYVNLSAKLGLDVPIPTRGVAVADTDGDGGQEFAIARQWGAPAFYRNTSPERGAFLGLRLHRPASAGAAGGPVGTPAYGAKVLVTTADGHRQVAQLDGGGGHSGKRSFDVFFGLGDQGSQPVSAEISWRDLQGTAHVQTVDLAAGWHDLMLTDQVKEVAAK
ncbi:RNA-binding protein [Micromonospora terminaliae]|uniref:CRTAC1 family protein n=1 Tax=Micromonospora terminaliae TaxID=1914461 RepID=A0AAJ2ZJY7_9ACTN|nr:CRTAC1 family protein [Micromonospora terminaliae]NES30239.1 CRTAC1 family protein [Micromonospora terminaliae]QGL46996.1 RNA-binding protein [Micromonospora terminaliae]